MSHTQNYLTEIEERTWKILRLLGGNMRRLRKELDHI